MENIENFVIEQAAAEFDLDEAGAVTRLVLQPHGIFAPKP